MKHLVTPRLLMRPFLPDDLADLYSLYSDPEVMRYIGDGTPLTMEQTRQSLERMMQFFDESGYGRFAVFERKEKRFIGRCGLNPLESSGLLELDYLFLPDSWGKGYATEASMQVLRTALGEWGLEKIVAITHPENRASKRVMEKIGMTCSGKDSYYGGDVEVYTSHSSRNAAAPLFQSNYRQNTRLSMPAL